MRFVVDPDIRRASTLPGEAYADPACFQALRARMLPATWHVVAHAGQVEGLAGATSAVPVTLLPEALDEPLVLTSDGESELRLLSNVCTHRGNLLVERPCATPNLRCRYHGRRFHLDGRFAHMPEFQDAEDFPRPRDDLARVAVARFGPLIFASLAPEASIEPVLARLRQRLAFLPLDAARFDAATSRDYHVDAHFALYCDNYLEGFHVPFVHPGLSEVLDYGAYRTELFEGGNVQIGIAKDGEPCFEIPRDHPDHGERIAGYYYWLFPTTMINVYPWGLSVNVVRPRTATTTTVGFWSFVWDASRRDEGAGGDLHTVEMEDEAVVELVQRGVRARLYPGGRFSPTRETGVHQFHRLLARFLNAE